MRAFARAPSPARYLAAPALLRDAAAPAQAAACSVARRGRAPPTQGLDILARGAGLAPELLEALRALPPDARNGRRLAVISDLLTAHRLILARASGGHRELLQSLGPMRRGAGRRRGAR